MTAQDNRDRIDAILVIVDKQDPALLLPGYHAMKNGLMTARMRRGEHSSVQRAAIFQSLARQARIYTAIAQAYQKALEHAYDLEES